MAIGLAPGKIFRLLTRDLVKVGGCSKGLLSFIPHIFPHPPPAFAGQRSGQWEPYWHAS